jgi:hypothetical protein
MGPRASRAILSYCPGARAVALAAGLAVWVAAGAADAQLSRPIGAGMRDAGMADAVRSVATGHSALVWNPAAMSQLIAYELHVGYGYNGLMDSHTAGVSVVDSATNPYISVGVGYAFNAADPIAPGAGGKLGADRMSHRLRGALSSGYRGEGFSAFVGASVQWQRLELDEFQGTDHFGVDVGALLIFADMIRLGIVGHNLIEESAYADMPRQLGSGISLVYEGFTAAFDVTADFDTRLDTELLYAIGLQYVLMEMVPLRLGFDLDEITDSKRVTAGLGYWGGMFGIDIGYQQDVEDTDRFVVGIDFRAFIP